MYIIGDSKYEKNEKEQQVESYQTVYRGGMGEIIEKKSRFIAEVYPIESEEQAAQILEETRKKYWDARHHCWAYVLGRNPAAERMSDDGEPAGTAGKPILEVIRGRKLTDVLVIVTRYFGGTLLGTFGSGIPGKDCDPDDQHNTGLRKRRNPLLYDRPYSV